jgi:phosphoesterase RecJ-like protein
VNNLSVIAEAVKRTRNALVCGHIMPDGDSIGSVLAMGLALSNSGKQVTMAGPDPIPEIYNFLPGAELFQTHEKPPSGRYDTLIVLDCSISERMGENFRDLLEHDMVVISLDHHIGSEPFAALNFIDCKAAATGEIVFDLLDLMGMPLTVDIATCLYTAIITDTGSFQYENTTAGTHYRIARLIEGGALADQIHTRLYEEKPLASLRLLGSALDTLNLSACGRIAWMTVRRETLGALGAEDEHADGLAGYARAIKGVQVGVLFFEKEPGKFKVGFRSKNPVDVNRIARVFGGGGHSRAAGCMLEGSLPEVQERVIVAVLNFLGEGNGRHNQYS